MLIRMQTLELIKAGKVKLAFRKWKKPSAKTGGTLNTRIGRLNIVDVQKTSLTKITEKDALAAGFECKAQLVRELENREGDLYRIELEFGGDDPRIQLRQDAKLTKSEMEEVLVKLERMDARSSKGPWTRVVLNAIKKQPKTLAADIAQSLGYEKSWFKPNVRKLKNMGLTISHEVGYSLSPRGKVVLKKLEAKT